MIQGLIIISFTAVLIGTAAYLLNQIGFGQNLLESSAFIVLGIILLIFTATAISHHSSS